MDRHRPSAHLGRGTAPRAGARSQRRVKLPTHALATTLGVKAMGLHGGDVVLAFAFGIGIDIDHLLKLPFYLKSVGFKDRRGHYWRASVFETRALPSICPLGILRGHLTLIGVVLVPKPP